MSETLRRDLFDYAGALAAALHAMYPDAVSIILKGSAYKQWDSEYDFIPGLSDLDVHVYRPGGLVDPFGTRRRLLAAVGEPPGRTPLQLLMLDVADLPDPWTLLDGTYEVLAGSAPPLPQSTAAEMRSRDRDDLLHVDGWIRQVAGGVVGKIDEELWEFLKRVRWMFPSILGRVATVAGEDPSLIWRMNRTALLRHTAELPSVAAVRSATVDYLDAAITAARSRRSADVERALERGLHQLQTTWEWVRATE